MSFVARVLFTPDGEFKIRAGGGTRTQIQHSKVRPGRYLGLERFYAMTHQEQVFGTPA